MGFHREHVARQWREFFTSLHRQRVADDSAVSGRALAEGGASGVASTARALVSRMTLWPSLISLMCARKQVHVQALHAAITSMMRCTRFPQAWQQLPMCKNDHAKLALSKVSTKIRNEPEAGGSIHWFSSIIAVLMFLCVSLFTVFTRNSTELSKHIRIFDMVTLPQSKLAKHDTSSCDVDENLAVQQSGFGITAATSEDFGWVHYEAKDSQPSEMNIADDVDNDDTISCATSNGYEKLEIGDGPHFH